jgi:predicted nucleotide-binding protein
MAEHEDFKRVDPAVRLQNLKNCLQSLEDQDALLDQGVTLRKNFVVSIAQLVTIRNIFEDIQRYEPDLIKPFNTHGDPLGARSQIREARLKVLSRIEEITSCDVPANSALPVPKTAPIPPEAKDSRKVFVVYGRNIEARDAIFEFLRAINLDPIEWEEAIAMTGQTAPFTGTAIDVAFSKAQAAVILLSGDDMTRLGRRHLKVSDGPEERRLTPQARPNVLFEAGMAFGRYSERTLLVALEYTRPFSDIAGRHIIYLADDIACRQRIADRLKTAKCDVRTDYRADWHRAGNFEAARYITCPLVRILSGSSSPSGGRPLTRKRSTSSRSGSKSGMGATSV